MHRRWPVAASDAVPGGLRLLTSLAADSRAIEHESCQLSVSLFFSFAARIGIIPPAVLVLLDSLLTSEEEEEEEEEEEGLFKAASSAVNEEDPERDRATQV